MKGGVWCATPNPPSPTPARSPACAQAFAAGRFRGMIAGHRSSGRHAGAPFPQNNSSQALEPGACFFFPSALQPRGNAVSSLVQNLRKPRGARFNKRQLLLLRALAAPQAVQVWEKRAWKRVVRFPEKSRCKCFPQDPGAGRGLPRHAPAQPHPRKIETAGCYTSTEKVQRGAWGRTTNGCAPSARMPRGASPGPTQPPTRLGGAASHRWQRTPPTLHTHAWARGWLPAWVNNRRWRVLCSAQRNAKVACTERVGRRQKSADWPPWLA